MSFLRGENVICGTSTTGTGTLTLAACPVPPGGVDPFAAFTGRGNLGTSVAVPMTYVVIEYVDGTLSTAKQQEKGVGVLLIGANIGATTLARTTVHETATSLNTTTPTYNVGAPTAITIGTAANVLVFVGASANDIPAYCPYLEGTNGDLLGLPPAHSSTSSVAGTNLASGFDFYQLFEWRTPMLVKKASCRVFTAYTGSTGSPISSVYARIYAINSSGRPGKVLIDFGTFGTNPLNVTGNISSAAHSTGFSLLPGEYYFDLAVSFSGATGTVTQPALNTFTSGVVNSSRQGMGSFQPYLGCFASSATLGTGPDPANTTGYTGATAAWYYMFLLNSS